MDTHKTASPINNLNAKSEIISLNPRTKFMNGANFRQLLFRAGFYTAGFLDKKRASDFLHCTIRTLDRWIKDNNPCPRAVMLLKQKTTVCPWPGAKFDHNEKLVVPGVKNGFSLTDLQMFYKFHRESRETGTENENLVKLMAELRDDKNAALTLQKLLGAINQLNEVAREPIFQKLGNVKKLRTM